jgi:transposase InsO family protein
MDKEAKDKILNNLYYEKHMKIGRDKLFDYIRNTLNNTNISRRYIMDWLKHQQVHQIYTAKKKQTNIRPIITSKVGSIIAIDLIDFSNKPSAGNFRYILNMVDTFSRKVWLRALKEKTIVNVNRELVKVLKEIKDDGHNVRVLQSDSGNEFKQLELEPGIKHLTSRPYTPQQNAIVERSNGTVKRILNKILYDEGKKDWKRYLPVIEDVYNSTLNRITKKSPNEAYNLSEEQQVDQHDRLKNEAAKSFKEIDTVLEVGDFVRIVNETGKIKSKGQPIYSLDIYKVLKVIKGNKKAFTINRYKLIDSSGIVQKNTYALSKLLLLPKDYEE